MFRKVSTVVVVVLAAVGSVALATAAEPKTAPTNQITNSIGMKLTLVPSGEFMMGSGESAKDTAAFFNKIYGSNLLKVDLFKGEHPQHQVRITRPFYLGACHVTRGQFRQFVADTEYTTDAEKGVKPGALGWNPDTKKFGFNLNYSWRKTGFEQTDEHPVVNVSWNDAVAFCKWLSKKEGKTYRLPTEAEWEYACRAGTTTRYSSGDDPETLAEAGNVADATFKEKFPKGGYTIKASDGYVYTAPVGKFKPNAFGLYDMHGNAWQWCSDWYGEKYNAASPADDPTGPVLETTASFVAAPGLTGQSTRVPPDVAGSRRASGSTAPGSVLPRRFRRRADRLARHESEIMRFGVHPLRDFPPGKPAAFLTFPGILVARVPAEGRFRVLGGRGTIVA